ncbi:MAG: hypothetical protein K2P58_03645 [Hyphomonadaceae bacterium]|nr:hypothetical protein [Hyphomonadaceae bacterium]
MKRIVAGVALALLAACTSQPATYRDLERMANQQQREAISRPPPDTCGLEAHRGLIGAQGSGIDVAALPAGTRVVCHDCMVTMDYHANRLNVLLGPDGSVAGLRCG